MMEPFDRDLPSPIAAVLTLRSSAEGAVVSAGDASDVQRAMYLRTSLDEQLAAHLRGPGRRELVIITGSAGGGKSAAIDLLIREGVVAREDVIEDATHAESPRDDQLDRLANFFAPFADGTAARPGADPRVIALNTGMALRFFDRASERGFSDLERLFRARVGLAPGAATPLDDRVLVLNLDARPTTGSADSLFKRMLEAFEPDRTDGLLMGSERCGTCKVRAFCFVRTNAVVVSTPEAAAAIDGLVHRITLERGRDLPPRALWDVASDLVTGGEPFTQSDPCDRIAELAATQDAGTVWRRLVCNGLFVTLPGEESRLGALGLQLRSHDPSLMPTKDAHDVIASAGIRPEDDAAKLAEFLAAPKAEAVPTSADALTAEGVQPGPGRGLARAAYLSGRLGSAEAADRDFSAALEEYARYASGAGKFPALTYLRDVAAAGLVRGFGAVARGEDFLPADARAAAREVRLFIQADLRDTKVLDVSRDPVLLADPVGAAVLSYRPLRIVLIVRGSHPVHVTLPLFRLLADLAAGVAHAGAEGDRFEALRRVIERAAPSAANAPLLISIGDGQRFKLARRQVLGGRVIRALEEVS